MRYALFLGCTVPVRNMNYEMSSRKVAEHLGIELVDSDDFSCCGYPMKGVGHHTAMVMACQDPSTATPLAVPGLSKQPRSLGCVGSETSTMHNSPRHIAPYTYPPEKQRSNSTAGVRT